MTISQVALSNTFNEFRQSFNDVANTTNALTDVDTTRVPVYASTISANSLTATANVSAANVNVSTLTSGRVALAGAGGRIQDDDGLTYNTSTNTLTSGNLAVSGTSSLVGNVTVNTDKLTITASNGTISGATANVSVATVKASSAVQSGSQVAGFLTEVGSNEEKHTFIGAASSNDAIDVAVVNQSTGTLAYSEFIAMNNTGNTDSGWISMGINSSNYNDPAFALTKKDDAYILFEAPEGSTGTGDLIIGTGANGTSNKIILGAGGFSTGNSQVVITPDVKVAINIPTNSSSTTTGALVVSGGIGLAGNLNVGGNVTITGAISLQGSGNTVSTSSLSVANSLLFLAANNNADILDFGVIGEYKYGATTKYGGIVRDATDGIFKLFANNSAVPANTVNFSGTGNLYAPLVIGSANVANTTASTSSTTGALTVGGGAGIAGAVFAGGAIRTNSTTTSTSTTTGALIVDGGVGIANTLVVGGKTTLTAGIKIEEVFEKVTVSATAATGTVNYDALTQAVLYYTSNSSGNWTLNVRGDSGQTMDSTMATGESVTFAFLVTNGGTAYYQTSFTIDGNAVTPKWSGGTAPSSGNASSIDVYTITVIKTGSATFTALAAQTKFA